MKYLIGERIGGFAGNLMTVCNVDQMVACLNYMLTNLQSKEVELGFDKIWSIGE